MESRNLWSRSKALPASLPTAKITHLGLTSPLGEDLNLAVRHLHMQGELP